VFKFSVRSFPHFPYQPPPYPINVSKLFNVVEDIFQFRTVVKCSVPVLEVRKTSTRNCVENKNSNHKENACMKKVEEQSPKKPRTNKRKYNTKNKGYLLRDF
jgi:hypothetical protein